MSLINSSRPGDCGYQRIGNDRQYCSEYLQVLSPIDHNQGFAFIIFVLLIFSTAQLVFAFLFPLIGCSLGIILSGGLAWLIAKTCKPAQNLTVSDCITIGIETGIQNVKIAVTIIFLIYKLPDQLYEFAQQLYFPLLYLGAQVKLFVYLM